MCCHLRWSFMASFGKAGKGDGAVPLAAHRDRDRPNSLWVPAAGREAATVQPGEHQLGLLLPRGEQGPKSLPKGLPGYSSGRNLPLSPGCDCRLWIRDGQGQEGRTRRAPAPRRPQSQRGEQRPAETNYWSSQKWTRKISSCSRASTAVGAEDRRAAPTGPAQPLQELEAFSQTSLGTSGSRQPGPSSSRCQCQGRAGAKPRPAACSPAPIICRRARPT